MIATRYTKHKNACTRECVHAHATPSLPRHLLKLSSALNLYRFQVAENPLTSFSHMHFCLVVLALVQN